MKNVIVTSYKSGVEFIRAPAMIGIFETIHRMKSQVQYSHHPVENE